MRSGGEEGEVCEGGCYKGNKIYLEGISEITNKDIGLEVGGSLLLLDGEEELELWRELFFAVETIGEVDSADAAIGVDGDSEGLDVVGAVGPAGEVGQIELDLVPTWVRKRVPSSSLMGMVQMKGLTRVVDW